MEFQHRPIYSRSGKRMKQSTERVVSPEELVKNLTSQMRRILKKLLKLDPELRITSKLEGGVEFKLSESFLFDYADPRYLRIEAEQARSLWGQYGKSRYHALTQKADKIRKVRKTALQQRQLLEEVLNGKREPPREKPINVKKANVSQKLPKKLLRIKKKRRFKEVNPKSAPWAMK